MTTHRFSLIGAWGSKLTSVAGHRCERCGVLYVTMNLAADESGAIFALDPAGVRVERSEMERGECNASS